MSTRIEYDWEWHEARLRAAKSYWVVTTRADGRPHTAPVWGVWLDGGLWFSTAADAVKARNLARDPRLIVHLDSADDLLLVEGQAEPVTDADRLAAADAAYAAKYRMTDGTPVGLTVVPGSVIFRVRPQTGMTWLEPAFVQTMTRWRFGAAGAAPTSEVMTYG
ncbi:MAG TPA: pyridoxamine 5'-phosphate oxidase family protein [Mycobacteriales bacterium]|nr:pyridoxamine 5'-phosphate oxidase family protein [Mycobacteriales bacterium]